MVLALAALAAHAPDTFAQPSVPWARPDVARDGPATVTARSISGQAEVQTVAEGEVELLRGPLVLKADRLVYRTAEDLAIARGSVLVQRDGVRLRGPELQLKVQAFEGFFLEPQFDFLVTGAGGRAQRLDFQDASRFKASGARFTGCPRDGSGDPDWFITARELHVDVQRNEGRALGAQLRFLGMPLLVIPSLSFPVTGERKSGWLTPQANLDSRSGLEFGVPYYWNIAPNRDATITPRLASRRGAAADTEFRYLEPAFEGRVALDMVPWDAIARRSRHALRGQHTGHLEVGANAAQGPLRYELGGARVSDNDWWKDFRTESFSLTPRLLPLRAGAEQDWAAWGMAGSVYARSLRWQVLQSVADPIAPPYDRLLQAGVQARGPEGGRWEWGVQAEFNRFTLVDQAASAARPEGRRAHLIGDLSMPRRGAGLWWVPRLSWNVAAYDLDQPLADGRTRLSRAVPTFSMDAGLSLERLTTAFGRELRQTLEPRLLYVRTPWREQSPALAFDSAAKDFSFSSIFTTNDFSGVDRVSDAHQINAGMVTRLVDAARGEELLRLGVVQRFLLADQRITPEGTPFTGRVSDLLVLGSTTVVPAWTLEGSLRWNAEINRPVRSVMSARYSPGEFRTLGLTYRFTRSLAEQWEFSGQWPLALASRASGGGGASTASAACPRRWFGVGRVNYSARERRITDAIAGVELDAGCWIGRLVAERLSTGRAEATTRLLIQLELGGLGRSGSGPVRVLKDNIPGYRALREEGSTPPTSDARN